MRKIELLMIASLFASIVIAAIVSSRYIDNRVSDVQDVAEPLTLLSP